jgi:uncharacterized RDD family membrane protein YckC
MEAGSNRVAQVFIWKQGAAPDLGYARQVLGVVNPEAYKAVTGENPPLHLFSVMGPWPDDFWARALGDMRAIPSSNGTLWTDTTRFDLAGWQGTDSRTGDKLFVVTTYSRPPSFTGAEVQVPHFSDQSSQAPVAQVPYYPQYPTGPLGWPPQSQQTQPQYTPPYTYPQYSGVPGSQYVQPSTPGTYPYNYNPLMTGPLTSGQSMLPAVIGQAPRGEQLPDSYAPFYAGFGQRLSASLIDFFLMSWFQAGTILGLVWASTRPQPADFEGWLGLYGPFLGLGVLVFAAYHVIGWSLTGRTWGKKLMGIRVVRADGGPPGFGKAMLRMLGYFFSTSIAGWGFLMIALDARRQGLHDKIAETYVVPDRPTVAAPQGLPGYRMIAGALPAPGPAPVGLPAGASSALAPTVGMAALAGSQPYGVAQVPATSDQTGYGARALGNSYSVQAPEGRYSGETAHERAGEGVLAHGPAHERAEAPGTYVSSNMPSGPLGPATDAFLAQGTRDRPERAADVEQARTIFKAGLAELEKGVRRSYNGMEVEPGASRVAAACFHDALQLVPTAVAYRYFHAVALRYSEGFEVAMGEFRQVLEHDPGHYEARQQVAYGPRWHDAFAYPAWGDPPPVEVEMALPEPIRVLLPQPQRPGTRLVLLREGSNKMVLVLSRTRRDTWAALPTLDMPSRIELVLSRTASGPIIAFYVVVKDDPDNPYKGETFLNPHDPGQPSDDACQLGQFMLAQLARQDHTYLVFVDENDHLLLSRKLVFDASTQVNIARVHYEVQSLPPQIMEPARFQQAAQWHMENFSLDQIK